MRSHRQNDPRYRPCACVAGGGKRQAKCWETWPWSRRPQSCTAGKSGQHNAANEAKRAGGILTPLAAAALVALAVAAVGARSGLSHLHTSNMFLNLLDKPVGFSVVAGLT